MYCAKPTQYTASHEANAQTAATADADADADAAAGTARRKNS